MQVLKYQEIVQQQFIQTMYMLDVVLPSLLDTISYAKASQSTLVHVYHDAYYNSISIELNTQKKVFELHLKNLELIYDEFKAEIEITDALEFDEEVKEFEHKLLISINKLKVLIHKMDIELQKFKGDKDEKVTK